MTFHKMVYGQRDIHLISQTEPAIKVVFTMKDFSGLKMAYAEAHYRANKTDDKDTHFTGNSLWNLGSMSEERLVKVIDKCHCIQDVIKYFGL